MSRIQFDRKKKKKNYVIPLVIIVLLYLIIPIYLISKGNTLIDKAFEKVNQADVFSPTVEFYNGLAFLNTAAAFPGFGGWSGTVEEESVEKMLVLQEKEFEEMCASILDVALPDSVEINYAKNEQDPTLDIKNVLTDSIQSVSLNDSVLNAISNNYCQPWIKFFDKTKSDKTRLHPFCEN